jgi:hypothetical protein
MIPGPNRTRTSDASPRLALFSGTSLLVASFGLLLCCRNGRPSSWGGEFAYLFATVVSLIGSPALCLLSVIDLCRGKRRPATLVVLACALVSSLLMAVFLWLRIQYPAQTGR